MSTNFTRIGHRSVNLALAAALVAGPTVGVSLAVVSQGAQAAVVSAASEPVGIDREYVKYLNTEGLGDTFTGFEGYVGDPSAPNPYVRFHPEGSDGLNPSGAPGFHVYNPYSHSWSTIGGDSSLGGTFGWDPDTKVALGSTGDALVVGGGSHPDKMYYRNAAAQQWMVLDIPKEGYEGSGDVPAERQGTESPVPNPANYSGIPNDEFHGWLPGTLSSRLGWFGFDEKGSVFFSVIYSQAFETEFSSAIDDIGTVDFVIKRPQVVDNGYYVDVPIDTIELAGYKSSRPKPSVYAEDLATALKNNRVGPGSTDTISEKWYTVSGSTIDFGSSSPLRGAKLVLKRGGFSDFDKPIKYADTPNGLYILNGWGDIYRYTPSNQKTVAISPYGMATEASKLVVGVDGSLGVYDDLDTFYQLRFYDFETDSWSDLIQVLSDDGGATPSDLIMSAGPTQFIDNRGRVTVAGYRMVDDTGNPVTETPTETPEVPTSTPTETPEVPTSTPTETVVVPDAEAPTESPVPGPAETPAQTPTNAPTDDTTVDPVDNSTSYTPGKTALPGANTDGENAYGGKTTALADNTNTYGKRIGSTRFESCDDLRVKYPNGVGKQGGRDVVRGDTQPVTNFYVDSALWEANTHLDRDKDGVACETLTSTPDPAKTSAPVMPIGAKGGDGDPNKAAAEQAGQADPKKVGIQSGEAANVDNSAQILMAIAGIAAILVGGGGVLYGINRQIAEKSQIAEKNNS